MGACFPYLFAWFFFNLHRQKAIRIIIKAKPTTQPTITPIIGNVSDVSDAAAADADALFD